jgi:hypothetical protein
MPRISLSGRSYDLKAFLDLPAHQFKFFRAEGARARIPLAWEANRWAISIEVTLTRRT